jgi:sulfur carrier protein ThiS adenylyltransferase
VLNLEQMTFKQIKEKLSFKTVGIAGAGGLGSNCAASLVRAGVGRLIVADFDSVSESNLNRQFYFQDQIGMKKVVALAANLYRINPLLQLILVDKKLDPSNIAEVFAQCDIVVEALDDKLQKQLLVETLLEHFPLKPIVIGDGMAGWGGNNLIKTETLDNMHICGDQVTEISPECPPISPRVGIVAHMQANMVLELLLGKME